MKFIGRSSSWFKINNGPVQISRAAAARRSVAKRVHRQHPQPNSSPSPLTRAWFYATRATFALVDAAG